MNDTYNHSYLLFQKIRNSLTSFPSLNLQMLSGEGVPGVDVVKGIDDFGDTDVELTPVPSELEGGVDGRVEHLREKMSSKPQVIDAITTRAIITPR